MRSPLFLFGLAIALTSGCGEDEDTDKKSDTGETSNPEDTAPDDTDTEDTDVPYGPDNQWWHANTADVPTDLAGTACAQDPWRPTSPSPTRTATRWSCTSSTGR